MLNEITMKYCEQMLVSSNIAGVQKIYRCSLELVKRKTVFFRKKHKFMQKEPSLQIYI